MGVGVDVRVNEGEYVRCVRVRARVGDGEGERVEAGCADWMGCHSCDADVVGFRAKWGHAVCMCQCVRACARVLVRVCGWRDPGV